MHSGFLLEWQSECQPKEAPNTLVLPSCPQDSRQVKVRLKGLNLPYCIWFLLNPSIKLKFNVLVENSVCYHCFTIVDVKCGMLFYRVLLLLLTLQRCRGWGHQTPAHAVKNLHISINSPKTELLIARC